MTTKLKHKAAGLHRRHPGDVDPMTEADGQTQTRMEVALENACRIFPNGGDHESRRHIAEQLKLSVASGNTTLEGLCALADRLVRKMSKVAGI